MKRTWMKSAMKSAMALAALLTPAAFSAAPALPALVLEQSGSVDRLVFRSGKIVEGRLVSETDTTVKFEVNVAGIKAVTEYSKSEILKVERGAAPAPEAPKAESPAGATGLAGDESQKPASLDGKTTYYVIDLVGEFGEHITQTPMRDAVEDARRNNADVLIFVLENDWVFEEINPFEKAPDDIAIFDEIFRAEEMMPIFQHDIPMKWAKKPRIIFWVKNAMGGACLLPLVCPDVYFSSSARMGGLGNATNMFGSTGDEVVRQKQYSLRLDTAIGWANVGGYAAEIVKAMADEAYTLSVSFDGDVPVYHERGPKGANETLLTDDGKDANIDTIQALARNEGNDVLTLTAEWAYKLGVSKGTVDTEADLLAALDMGRSAVKVAGRSEQIMKGWKRSLEDAKRDILRLLREFGEIQVQGDYNDRAKARGQQIQKLEEIKKIMKRYGEALSGRWRGQNGVPDETALDFEIQRIKQEQMKDKK